MAEFTEVMKQRERICKDNNCDDCPLSRVNNGLDVICSSELLIKYPQQVEEIIMNWAKENPVQTNADKFKEVFGVELYQGGCVGVKCPSITDNEVDCKKCRYYNFWQQEYKEPKGEDE